MPTPATTVNGTAGARRQERSNAQAMPSVPFIRASQEHREPCGIDVSKQLLTSDQDLGVFDIPAYGYIRALWVLVTVSGGTGGAPAVVAAEDAPFNTLKNLFLTEPNGAVIAQYNSGHDAYLAHKYGGVRHVLGSDFRQAKSYVQVPATGAAWSFALRIPVEINLRDALGSLPNQNAAAMFKLRMTLAKNTDIGSGTWPTTLPTARIRVYMEAWDQPEIAAQGAVNQVTPPAMNTTQFWTPQVFTVNAGQNTLRLTRVGNYIRNLILIYRRAGTSRVNGETDLMAIDPLSVYLDTRPLDILQPDHFLQQQFERTGFGAVVGAGTTANETPGGLDNGVRAYDFMHEFDGTLGHENRDLWLPTLGSTRLEFQGSFANPGTLTVLTNDVAIAGNVFL